MMPEELAAEFGSRIRSGYRTISTQQTLPRGTPLWDVADEVRRRIETFGMRGGLIAALAHNVQPDTPLENIPRAMYGAVGCWSSP